MPIEINELTIRVVIRPRIEVDSTKLEDDVDGSLSATVVDRLDMPDTFTLLFHDPGRDILQRSNLEIGSG